MIRNRIAVLVVSWTGFADVWEPFFQFFFKFWPDCPFPVFIGSDRPLAWSHPRVRLVASAGASDYSSALLGMLESIEQEWLLLWVDDFFLVETVDTRRVLDLADVAAQENAQWLNFITMPFEITPLFANAARPGGISELPPGAPYRVTLGAVLCTKAALAAVLRPGETAWQIERNASYRSREFETGFFCLDRRVRTRPPIRVLNAIENGRWTPTAVRLFEREGLARCLGSRAVLASSSWWSFRLYEPIRYYAVKTLYGLGGERFMRWFARLISKRFITVQH